MNVFVTGGAGYIGSVCTEELLNVGHEVTVYDNLTEGHRAAVDSRARFILGEPEWEHDILNAVRESSPEAIIHFAASALVPESMSNPQKYFHNNVVNGLKLLDAAVECGVKKFVFSSTCATYGPPELVPMTEDLPQRPINPYGESKLMFEKILGWYRQICGIEFIAFRYFNAAGASEKFGEHHRTETHLIPNVHQGLCSHYRSGPGTHSWFGGGQARILQSWKWRWLLSATGDRHVCQGHGQENSRRRVVFTDSATTETGRLCRQSDQ